MKKSSFEYFTFPMFVKYFRTYYHGKKRFDREIATDLLLGYNFLNKTQDGTLLPTGFALDQNFIVVAVPPKSKKPEVCLSSSGIRFLYRMMYEL